MTLARAPLPIDRDGAIRTNVRHVHQKGNIRLFVPDPQTHQTEMAATYPDLPEAPCVEMGYAAADAPALISRNPNHERYTQADYYVDRDRRWRKGRF